MIYPRFAYIPQPIFSDQRDTERVFVVARRHFVDFLQSLVILLVMILLPIMVGVIFGSSIMNAVRINEPYWADSVILAAMVYFLILIMVFMTSWVGFYYNLLIVTDERIVEITQRGFFSREIFQLTYDQIEDVDFSSRGLLATYLDVGDIEIQTAGPQRNFYIRKAPKPQLIGAIIHDLEIQTKNRVATSNRMPAGEIIGLIISTPVLRTAKVPPIMNFRGGLNAARRRVMSETKDPKSMRQKFDRWWWTLLKREQVIFLDYQSHEFTKTDEIKEGEKSDREMIDL
jgi:hypothetical protein